jgi:hypothetical protein
MWRWSIDCLWRPSNIFACSRPANTSKNSSARTCPPSPKSVVDGSKSYPLSICIDVCAIFTKASCLDFCRIRPLRSSVRAWSRGEGINLLFSLQRQKNWGLPIQLIDSVFLSTSGCRSLVSGINCAAALSLSLRTEIARAGCFWLVSSFAAQPAAEIFMRK